MSKKDEKPTLDLESLAAHIEREEADYGEDGHVCIALPLAKDVLAALEHRKHLLNVSENVDWAREISRRLYELVGDQLGELKHGPDCPMCVIEPALDVLVERIPELERLVAEYRQDHLERVDEARSWRERAERVEAAARRAYEFLVQEGYECGATSELRAALAAAPAIDANAYHEPLAAAFQQREKVAELDESGFEPDGGDLCEECEKTLAWRPVGWWVAELESKFPGLRVVRREQAAAPAEEGSGG